MFNWIINLFKQKEPEVVAEVKPAEVAKPTPGKCGCGRSPTGFCKGYHTLSPTQWNEHADNPAKVQIEAPVEKTVDVTTLFADVAPVEKINDAAALVADAAAAKVKKPRAKKPKVETPVETPVKRARKSKV